MPILSNGDGRVAQLVERWPYKPDVAGSSPVPPTERSESWHRHRLDCLIVPSGELLLAECLGACYGSAALLEQWAGFWPPVNLVSFPGDSVKARVDS